MEAVACTRGSQVRGRATERRALGPVGTTKQRLEPREDFVLAQALPEALDELGWTGGANA
jgi:hypothetical protein